jgi:hypothetical protein
MVAEYGAFAEPHFKVVRTHGGDEVLARLPTR